VGDRHQDIVDAIHDAHRESVAVVVTGGLGPTPDDLTREALAGFVGESLFLDEELAEVLVRRYRRRGREMAETNLRQAYRTPSGHSIPNPRGTAPGLLHLHEGVPILLLPGVPAELRSMWEQTGEGVVAPLVKGGAPRALRLRSAGLPESDAAQLVGEIAAAAPALELAFCVTRFGVDILLRTEDEGLDLDAASRPFVDALGEKLYTIGDGGLPEVLAELLWERGESVAVAESCTGGLLGAELSSVPGSSRYFRGGILAYADEVKRRQLGVEAEDLRLHGAVSAEVAEAMARGARERVESDWALAITGIAGPDGGSEEKPVGTVFVALAGAEGAQHRRLSLPGDRAQNREWSVAAALDLLRRHLLARGSSSPKP
jgi:nicotinamide-nucleotide amidase